MSLKEKERRKEQQDKFQAILSALLKDEDNKYCVDCDAKGPRWASWNLGIFLCIRCAGIHRNLGVHISKVKSVNLDTWTPEQVAMIQEIGNSRARAAYEANLPDGYRRPQTDSALEAFIRAKYEHKKYVAREWIPPQPKVPKEWLEDKTEKKKPKPKPISGVQLSSVPKSSPAPVDTSKSQPPVQKTEVSFPVPTEFKVNSVANDLLGLDLGPPQTIVQQPPQAQAPSGNNDLLELFGGAQAGQQVAPAASSAQVPNQTNAAVNGSAPEGNLFGDDADVGGEKKASTKDSIMALFGGSSSQPQMYGVPGADGQFYNFPYYGYDKASQYHYQQAFCTEFANFGHSAAVQNNQQIGLMAIDSAPGQFKPGMDFSSLVNQLSAFNETAPTYVYKLNQIYARNQKESEPEEGMSKQETKTKNGQTVTLVVPSNSQQAKGKTGQNFNQNSRNDMRHRGRSNFITQCVVNTNPFLLNYGNGYNRGNVYNYQGGMYIPQNQQAYPGMVGQQQGMMGQQPGMVGQQQGMMGQQPGMVGQQQGMMGQQPGMVGQQPGMVGQQPGMMGQQPGMMGQQPGMMGQQTGMMPQQPGLMGQQQGIIAQQQGIMGQQRAVMGQQNPGMMGPQQNVMGMMGQQQGMMGQPGGMMGTGMMNGSQSQGGMFNGQGQMMGNTAGMYTPQQMQQIQYQQMQQKMVQQGTANWGNPAGQTLSNNLWQ